MSVANLSWVVDCTRCGATSLVDWRFAADCCPKCRSAERSGSFGTGPLRLRQQPNVGGLGLNAKKFRALREPVRIPKTTPDSNTARAARKLLQCVVGFLIVVGSLAWFILPLLVIIFVIAPVAHFANEIIVTTGKFLFSDEGGAY